MLSPGVLAGLRSTEIDGASHNGTALGFELGLYLDAARLRGEVPLRKGAELHARTSPRSASTSDGRPPSSSPVPPITNPTTYVELQWRTVLYGLAAGVAFSPGESNKARTGLQLTPLLGPFYARLDWRFDGGMALEIGVAIKFPMLFSFGG